MSNLWPVNFLLGWHIERNREGRIMFVHQAKYAAKVLDRFGLKNCRSVKSPEDPSYRISDADSPSTDEERKAMEAVPYRVAVVPYDGNKTRPSKLCTTSESSVTCRILADVTGNMSYVDWLFFTL